jgi:hypothetical protein
LPRYCLESQKQIKTYSNELDQLELELRALLHSELQYENYPQLDEPITSSTNPLLHEGIIERRATKKSTGPIVRRRAMVYLSLASIVGIVMYICIRITN